MAIVTVEKNRYTVDSLYQWDKDQDLQIYGLSLATIPEIHFTNHFMDKAIVRQATMDNAGVITADIPNSLLQKPYKITAYVCIYEGETFKTLYAVVIPVEARSKPADYTIEVTDDEVYSFNALENKLENVLAVSLTRYDEINAKYAETNEKYAKAVKDLEETTAEKLDIIAWTRQSRDQAVASAQSAQQSANSAGQALETIEELMGNLESGQSNWDQNDETAPDYIKNRTHWKEEAKASEEIFNASITFSTNSNGLTNIAVGTNVIKVDKTYIVTYGGTDYECTAYKLDGSVCLGNPKLLSSENDTGEPFVIECLTATSAFFYKNNTGSGTETVVIKTKATETVYHTVPDEYLPDGKVGKEKEVYILPETSVTFTDMEGMLMAQVELLEDIIPLKEYTVNYGGVDYNCMADADGMLGNVAFMSGGDTGEPFMIFNMDGVSAIIAVKGITTDKASIKYNKTIPIDSIYTVLPTIDLIGLGLGTITENNKVSVSIPLTDELIKKLNNGIVKINVMVSGEFAYTTQKGSYTVTDSPVTLIAFVNTNTIGEYTLMSIYNNKVIYIDFDLTDTTYTINGLMKEFISITY